MSLADRISNYFDERARDWELEQGLKAVPESQGIQEFIASGAREGSITVVLPPCKNPLVAGLAALGNLDDENGVSYDLSEDFVKSSDPYKALVQDMFFNKGCLIEVAATESPCFGRFRYRANVDLKLTRLENNR